MDIDRKQRTDIDTVTNDRLTLAIDESNMEDNPYVHETIKGMEGNNWVMEGNEYVKYNLVEDDNLTLIYDPITKLSQRSINKVTVSFDYVLSNNINRPILDNISLVADSTYHEIVNYELNNSGHVDIDCLLFGIDNEVLNNIISERGFGIGLNFNGNKSNATLKLSNIHLSFEFANKLSDETDAVVNRLIPEVDFWREGSKLYLQVGGVDKSKEHESRIDSYTKDEVDELLLGKVNIEFGKGLSANDYTLSEKNKLQSIENEANNYVHPLVHNTNIIVEPNALVNIGTDALDNQETINSAIDSVLEEKADISSFGAVALSNDYDDLDNKPLIPENISDLNNDSDFITTSETVGLIKNDGSIDTTTYLSSLPSHTHDDRYYTEAEVDTALNSKQDSLISGTNIKTINNTSLLGTGNINIQGGGSITIDSTWITGSTNPVESQLIQSALSDKTDVGHTHNDTEINSSYTNIEMSTLIFATLNDVIAYNEPFTRINRALEHMLDNWEDYD